MSFNAVAKAVEIPLSGNLKLVFILMANYADEKDCCYPSQPTLARQAGVSIKTIQRVIEKLEELGFVKTLRKGTGNKSSLYQLIFYLGSSQNVAPDNLSGSQIVHPDQSNCPPRVVKLSTDPIKTLSMILLMNLSIIRTVRKSQKKYLRLIPKR